jgi:NarL family two-component system sensor histidine kinase LiaS
MVGTHLIRKSGRNSNSFFSWERVRNHARSVLGLLVPGLLALAFGSLILWRQADLWRDVSQTNRDMQTTLRWVQESREITTGITQFLLTEKAADLGQVTANLKLLINALQDKSLLTNNLSAYDVQSLTVTVQTTLNIVRSLETVMQANTPATGQLRQNVQASANVLLTKTEELSRQVASRFEQELQHAQNENAWLQIALVGLLLASIGFGIVRYLHLTWTTASGLDELVYSIQTLTDQHTPMPPTTLRNDQIRRLVEAFNTMAATLQQALRTESAANEQNRKQIIKLAQQERMTAILEERQRIARELHDSVKQQLFSITLATGAAVNLLEHDPALARTYLAHVQQMGALAQSEMTTLLQEMTPLPLHDHHLEDAVYQYLAPLCDLHRLKLLWRVEGTNTLTTAQEHTLFRIIQEAASNVVRHSRAIVLRVSLHFGLQTRLVIEDDGAGFDPEAVPPTSTGLATMRLRVKQMGGRLALSSIIGQGTRLEIILDLRRK